MPTSIEELERVHLRFIRVPDDAKLTDILSKILPNIICTFLEPDMVNATSIDNAKINAIEQILKHLLMKVKNSKIVNPPWISLLDILNQESYQNFTNQMIKRHVFTRITDFFFESFSRIPLEQDQGLIHVLLQIVDSDEIKYTDKCRMFLILLQKMQFYVKEANLDKLITMIEPIFTNELKASFLQMSLYYILFNIHPYAIQRTISENFSSALNEMTLKFKQEIGQTNTQFIQSYESTILKFVSTQRIFTANEILPLIMIASLSPINATKEYSDLQLRSLMGVVDTKDQSISQKIYNLIFSELYIYKDWSEREDQEVEGVPVQMQIKLIEYLIKFEGSAKQHPLNQKLVFHCLQTSLSQFLEKIGLQFIKHMIRYSDLVNEQSTVQFLKQTLLKITEDQQFGIESQSYALQLLGDMAVINYDALNDNIDLALQIFQKLKARISELEMEGVQSIRTDFTANNYIETLNRFRDCFETKLTDQNKRLTLVRQVLNYLNKEQHQNSEMIYLLFLYLTRLDQGQYNSSVLLHSIILKDHTDIKIKKEAQHQIDLFNQQSTSERRILRPFLQDIEIFLKRNNMEYIYTSSVYQIQEILTFNNSQSFTDIIEKMLEITQFVLKFYQQESQNQENLMDLGDKQDVQELIERILMMNLNQNFQLIKKDFTEPLNLIHQYVQLSEPVGALPQIGMNFIYKLSVDSVNLNQRVLSLNVLLKILKYTDSSNNAVEEIMNKLISVVPAEEKLESLTFEKKLNALYALTVINRTRQIPQYQKYFKTLVEGLLGSNVVLSPNNIEQIKFLCACLRKLGQSYDLNEYIFDNQFFTQIIDQLITFIKRNELDIVFRKYISSNLAGIMKETNKEIKLQRSNELVEAMLDIDNTDLQDTIGKTLAKLNKYASDNDLSNYAVELIKRVFQKESITLNQKRNSTIYLYQVVELYGAKQKGIQDLFLEIQRVFMKFLFDRRAYMQDLSSKALSKIYHLGAAEVRNQLVDNLSKTFSGEKSASEHQEKDENNELFLEFKDNTSTEQKEKLKTYKDLCNIAVELGHRELIYSFLEVHRHLAHYQDIKNAAKGLSSIIMLDDRLRRDLIKIAPKILLMSYDHNDEIKQTMKELWSNLIEIEQEESIINSRWEEILKEAFAGLSSKEYRRRQSSALALSDLMNQRSWEQIKDKYREIFLIGLGLLDDQKDSVKKAAYFLIKTMKRITLKLGNIYTNGNVQELEEVLKIAIPMLLDDCLKSNMKAVKFFGLDLLFDLVKTSQNQNMMKQLKIQNKYERQLVFNYNSEQKMKEIMNQFLDRIILEIISNFSQMNKSMEVINQLEQLAAMHGMSGSSKAKSSVGITEGEINDYRLKFSKDSTYGEILRICRDQMTEETFNKILNDLIQFIRSGHDQATKTTAIGFVQDIILENKLHLITPQNSRKICQKLIEIYTQNSVQASLQIKESMQHLYANLVGLQMKILKEYPNTVTQLVEQVVSLPHELDVIIVENMYEICKNIPESMLKSQQYITKTYPIIFINKFKNNDHRLKTLCKKAHTFLEDHIPQIVEQNSEEIFKHIHEWLDSAQYDDRVSASMAMQEISSKLGEDDLRGSQNVQQVVEKMHQLIAGKYFNNKETVVEGFMTVISIANLQSNAAFINQFIGDTCYKQIEKHLDQRLGYKNQIMKAVKQCLESSNSQINSEVRSRFFELFQGDLKICLQKVSEKAAMIESMDEFEEKRDDEKQTLQSVLYILDCEPYLIDNEGQLVYLCEVSSKYYQITNWIVRNGILKAFLQLLKQNKTSESVFNFIDNLLQNIADVGEKYESNLKLISEILALFLEKYLGMLNNEQQERIQGNSLIIIEIFQQKGTEEVRKNNDIIKRFIKI